MRHIDGHSTVGITKQITVKSLRLFWLGQFIGEIADARVDMFFVYGKWKPAGTDASNRFTDAVRTAVLAEGDVQVSLGENLVAFVAAEPNDEIEVRIYPGMKS